MFSSLNVPTFLRSLGPSGDVEPAQSEWVSECAGAGGHSVQCHSKTSRIKGNRSGNLCTWQRRATIWGERQPARIRTSVDSATAQPQLARAPRTRRLLNFKPAKQHVWVFLLRDGLQRVATQVRRRRAELLPELEERNPRSPPSLLPSLPVYIFPFLLGPLLSSEDRTLTGMLHVSEPHLHSAGTWSGITLYFYPERCATSSQGVIWTLLRTLCAFFFLFYLWREGLLNICSNTFTHRRSLSILSSTGLMISSLLSMKQLHLSFPLQTRTFVS